MLDGGRWASPCGGDSLNFGPGATYGPRPERKTYKKTYNAMANACSGVGVEFLPLLVETHSGALSPGSRNSSHSAVAFDIAKRGFCR
eukprot:506709-Amphidinium_carterae.1